jgi:hypothetical protein
MKKVRLLLTALVLLSATINGMAKPRLGIETGLNIANNTSSSNSVSAWGNEYSYNGYLIGPTVEFKLPQSSFYLDVAGLYSKKGIAFKNYGTATVSYFEVPVNFKYKMGSPNILATYLYAGPYVGWGLSDSYDSRFKTFDAEKTDFGINAGFGFQMLNNFQLGLNYGRGFGNNTLNNKFSYKNQLWSVTFTYYL